MPNSRKDITTIQVDKDVKEDLNKLITRKGETYSQIIRRLIDSHVINSKERQKAVKETTSALKRKRAL